jgi:hypothetical protein
VVVLEVVASVVPVVVLVEVVAVEEEVVVAMAVRDHRCNCR